MNFDEFYDKARAQGFNILDLMHYKNGKLEYERHEDEPGLREIHSISKNFTATAIGIAQTEGFLSLDDPIELYLPQIKESSQYDRLKRLSIKNLLTNTAGNREGNLFSATRFSSDAGGDWLKAAIELPIYDEPGKRFCYSNSNYYMLSLIIENATTQKLSKYLEERLFLPLGIKEYKWLDCPNGHTFGASDLYLTTEDMAKLGLMYLGSGMYKGVQVIDSDFAFEATSPQVRAGRSKMYGYSFWIESDDCWYCSGSKGQFIVARKKDDTITAINSLEKRHEELQSLVLETFGK